MGIERFEERRLLATFAGGDWGWAASFGDAGNRSMVNGVAEDSLGNSYAVGWYAGTVNFDPSNVAPALKSAGGRDIFVAKYSPNGEFDWVRSFGAAGVDEGTAITVSPDGQVLLCGFFSNTVDFDPGDEVASLTSAGSGDGFVVALTDLGEYSWSGRFGGSAGTLGFNPTGDWAQSIDTDASGNIFVAGTVRGSVSFAFGGVSKTVDAGDGFQDSCVLSLSPKGALRFANVLDGSFINYAGTMRVDKQGNFVVAGVLHSTTVDFDPGVGVQRRGFVGVADAYVAKYDNHGNYMWAHSFGSSGEDHAAADVDDEGNVYVAGRLGGSFDADPGPRQAMLSSAGGSDAFVIGLDPNGNYRWSKVFGGAQGGVDVGEWAWTIAVQTSGELLVSGRFDGTFRVATRTGEQTLATKGRLDAFILKLTRADGGVVAATSFGGPDNDYAWAFAGPDGNAYYCGATSGPIDVDPSAEGVATLAAGDATTGFIWKLSGEETVSVRVPRGRVEEGNSGTRAVGFEITRTGPATGRLSVGWAVGGGGANPVDPGDFPEDVFPSGTVEFLPGETRKTVTFDLRGDTTEEEDETIVVRIADAGTTRVGTRTGEVTVLDDDFSTPYRLRPLETGWYEGDTRTSPMTFELRRNGDLTAATEVAWNVRGSGAAPADSSDFAGEEFPSGTVRFSPGQRTQYLTVNVRGDRDVEADESFTVSIVGRTDGEPVLASAVGVILNDDIDVAANNFIGIRSLVADRAEGTSAVPTPFTFTVYREGMVTEAASVRWAVAGSGRAPATASDFSGGALPSGVVAFAAGETSKVITVSVNADSVSEADEGFAVTLSGATGARIVTPQAFGRIREDDMTVAVSVDAPEKLEGHSGSLPFVFTVTRPGDLSAPMTVRWRTLGSGGLPAGPADFVGGVLPTGTVAFAAGEATKTFTVAVAGDTLPERDERFLVEVAGDTIRPATAAATIVNDDVGLAFLPAAGRVLEGNSGTSPLTFTVCRTGPLAGATTVAWAVQASGTNPAAAADFTGASFPSGAVSFAAGERLKTIVVPVAGDTTFEPDETFAVVLSSAVGAEITTGSVTGTIVNDESGVSIAAVEAARREGDSGRSIHTFVVSRTNPGAETVRVNWSVAGTGAAAADAVDFASGAFPAGTIVFGAGETSRTIEVAVRGDTEIEADETFAVTLAGVSGATIAVASATATIIGDDSGIAVTAVQASAFEGNAPSTAFDFLVTRTGATVDTLAVSWAVFGAGSAPANAADFSGASLPYGSVTFKPGETTKTISIGVLGDAIPEPDEGFLVKLTSAGKARVITGTASATILGDDTGVSIRSTPVTNQEGQSGGTGFSFQAIRTGRTDTACSARWTVTGAGTLAAAAADFTGGQLPTGTVSFAAGETTAIISVSVAGDVVAEADEQFSVTLSDPVAAAIVEGGGRGVIRNDDTSVAIGPTLVSRAEGRSGGTAFVFGVTRTGLTGGAVTVAWSVSGLGVSPATDADFVGGTLPSGTVTLQPGQTSARIVVSVAGDTVAEADEGFAVTLSDAGSASIVRAVAEGSIINDDGPVPTLSATALAFAALANEKPVARAKLFV